MLGAPIGGLLTRAGDPDPALSSDKLRAFRCFVLVHGAARSGLWLAIDPGLTGPALPEAGLAATAALLTVCAVLAFLPAAAFAAARAALPLLGLQLFWTFPLTDNHFFIELYCVALLCLVDRSGDGEALALSAVQALTVLVLFQAGLQKVLHGQYFGGEFLAFMVGQGDRFADLFQLALPADEIARLQGYDPLRTGSGPYRVALPAFVLLSNAVWIAELMLAGLLLVRRTRTAAAVGAVGLVLALQLGAREAGFALLFCNQLLLFLPGNPCGRLLPGFVALYLYALGAAVGLLPGGSLLGPGSL